MHVGFSLLTLFPGQVGGSESYVRGLLGAFAAGDGPDRVSVLANRHVLGAYRPPGGPVELVGVGSYRAGARPPGRLAAMLHAAARPRAVARDVPSGIDVLHHPVTVPVPRLDLPTVTTLHDLHHHELPETFSRAERAFRRWAYDGASRRAHIVLTPSSHSRDLAVDRLGLEPGRVHAVHSGIDHVRFHPHVRPAELELSQRFLFYPANLWPHKNHDRLVEALALMEDRDIALVMSGQPYGRLEALTARARRLGVGGRLRHLGHLPPGHVPAVMAAATALIFPSLAEGFGQPPLEAMACGTPVAVSTAGSLPEVCGAAALTFDPRDPQAIAAAADRLAGDAALRERLRAAGPPHAADFTWAAAARGHLAAYRAALETR